jgi:hypothetical protein
MFGSTRERSNVVLEHSCSANGDARWLAPGRGERRQVVLAATDSSLFHGAVTPVVSTALLRADKSLRLAVARGHDRFRLQAVAEACFRIGDDSITPATGPLLSLCHATDRPRSDWPGDRISRERSCVSPSRS